MRSAARSPGRPALRRWLDRFAAGDPGGFSRRAALRAFLSFIGTGAAMLAAGQPMTVALLGASMAMTVSVAVAEHRLVDEAISLALAVLSAAVAMSAGVFVARSPVGSAVALCAFAFVAVIARARGARAAAAGMLGFMGFFFALFVGARPPQVPWLAASVAIGGVVAAIVRFVLVPERPARVHADVLRAFRAQVRILLDALVTELERGGGERRLRGIRRQTGRVNEAALALEEAAGRTETEPPHPEARPWLMRLLDAEVAVDMLAEAVHRIAEHEWAPYRRRPLEPMMRAIQRWIDDGSDATRAEILRLLDDAESADDPTDGEARDPVLLARRVHVWSRVRRAVLLLLGDRPWSAFPTLPPTDARVTQASFRPGGGGVAGVSGLWPNLRVATQAAAAVALAVIAGRAISTERWYWAALGAFVVFLRATTVAETLSRAWQRILGTALGVVAGLAVAAPLRHHPTVAAVVALLAVLVSYGLLRVSYSGMVLFVTIALALLYQMMGRPVPGLMELRIAETAAGAGIGVIAAAVLFPLHSGRRVRWLVAEVLRRAALVIERATEPGVDARGDPMLYDDIRRVDRALAEVRNAVRPLWAPQLPVEPSRVTRFGRTAAGLAYAVRRVLVDELAHPSAEAGALARVGGLLAGNCRAVADALEHRGVPTLAPAEAAIAALGPTPRSLWADLDALLTRLVAEAELVPGGESIGAGRVGDPSRVAREARAR
jgi:uncharacterized membrane protein YccC